MIRALLQFTLIDLMVATVVVGYATKQTRSIGLVNGVILGAMLFALWWLCRLIQGLVERTHDEAATDAFFYAWILKYVVVATTMCGVAYRVRSASLWD